MVTWKWYRHLETGTKADEGYLVDPPAREGFEIVDGKPPEGTPDYEEPPNLQEQLNAIYEQLPEEAQADLGPLRAAIKLELEADPPRLNIARLIIERAQIPTELEEVRTNMLTVFPAADPA